MRSFVALALTLSLVGPITLSAQKPNKQNGKSQETQVTVVFSSNQREAARSYFVEVHGRGNCHPAWPRRTTDVCLRDRRRNATSLAARCRTGLFSRSFRWSYL